MKLVFDRINKATGSNAKLKIAIDEFTQDEHAFMEVCFNGVVYGISGEGIKKAIGYEEKSFGKCEDLGEYIFKKNACLSIINKFERHHLSTDITSFASGLKSYSGNAQIEFFKQELAKFDMDVLPWVIRAIQKNMRIGLNLTSYNKVRQAHGLSLLKGFGVQLCQKIDVTRENFEKLSYPRIAEYKYDGIRTIITVKNGKVSLMSRSGKDSTEHYPEIVKLLEDKFNDSTNLILDSEIISSSFIKLSTRMQRKAENIEEEDTSLRPIIFDLLEENSVNTKDYDQSTRRARLDELASLYDLELSYLQIANDVDELLDFYNDARKIEQEGVVTKDLDMKWTEGSRDGWIKMVPIETLDLKIVDCYYGTGKNSKFISGVIVENADKTLRSKAASGITDDYRKILTELNDKKELIGKIAEIKYREISKTKNGIDSLRFPVFIGLREDKQQSD